ncbi:hypothetical protein EIN_080090 [Entamoeba invadens IP1]|uniref:hypothetical protein n=1 Tax=Entamoeba invadens IP1 TaxID=370355 RepID=UPI0002C3F074|nr:hypothetical protein EIN_080090 [Entamoeba invadens IP1]ELP85057.1 hypothetical protein EIN_080090 [Entamoeba invadens IP1]|eukprot:XP_004184403.1 hypothetical protein EIN_080090 [Entamoeba invadens IP1]
MGNKQMVKYSKNSSRSGSVFNPHEFIPKNRIKGHTREKFPPTNSQDDDLEISLTNQESGCKSPINRFSDDITESDKTRNFSPLTSPRSDRKEKKERPSSSQAKVGKSLTPNDITFTTKTSSLTPTNQRYEKKPSKFKIPKLSLGFEKIKSSLTSPRSPKTKSARSTPSTPGQKFTFEDKAAFFVSETGFNDFSIIYDSRLDELDARSFNAKVIGQQNIVIIAITKDSQFGMYQDEPLHKSEFGSPLVNESTDSFLFSFKEGNREPIVMDRVENQLKTITIYPDTEKNFVFTMFSAFWLKSDGKLAFHAMWKDKYLTEKLFLNPFVDKPLTEKVTCDRLLVLQLLGDQVGFED